MPPGLSTHVQHAYAPTLLPPILKQNPSQVELLLGWASVGGYEWSVSVPGPRGLTPLHLAALLPDGAIAKLLAGALVCLLLATTCLRTSGASEARCTPHW